MTDMSDIASCAGMSIEQQLTWHERENARLRAENIALISWRDGYIKARDEGNKLREVLAHMVKALGAVYELDCVSDD